MSSMTMSTTSTLTMSNSSALMVRNDESNKPHKRTLDDYDGDTDDHNQSTNHHRRRHVVIWSDRMDHNTTGPEDDKGDKMNATHQSDERHNIEQPPPRCVLEMKVGCTIRSLRDIVHPICRNLFRMLEKKGYANSLTSPYLHHFHNATVDETTGHHPLLYAVFDETGKLIKIGYTTDMKYRQSQYDNPHLTFVVLMHLHCLDASTHAFVLKQYRLMVDAICSHSSSPESFKRLLDTIVNRGGEELGCKKKIIHLMIELGGSLHYRLGAVADFLMCDTKQLDERERQVNIAVDEIMAIIRDTLDLSRKVHVLYTSSWMTGFHECRVSDPNANYGSKNTLIDYILSKAVKMEDTDTIPAPVYRNPTTSAQGFSKDFSKTQIEQGRSRLHNFIQSMVDNSFMLLDSNDILFKGTPHDMISLLSDEYLFFIEKTVWGDEMVVLVHGKSQKVVCCHRPPCKGGESRIEIPSWQCVLRCMSVEVMKRVVDKLENNNQPSSGDAILAGYYYEYIRNALHFSGKAYVPAAFVRDATTKPDEMPLRQNRLGKTVSDPNYPITNQLRTEYRRPTPVERALNPLIIDRACTRLTFIHDAKNDEQVRTSIQDADVIIKEDNPSSNTVRDRWESVLAGIDPESEVRQAAQRMIDSMKENRGNTNAYKLMDEELMEYDEDFQLMTHGLPLEQPFYVRATDHTDPVPTEIPDHRPVFATFTELGLRNRVLERRTSGGNDGLRFNTSSYVSERPMKYLQLKSVLDDGGRKQYIGENDGFLLVWLSERPENINQAKELQMKLISDLRVGKQFWLRQNSRSSSEIALPAETNGHPVFNMPVFTGVRDRLNKIDRAAKKGVVSGHWVLCEMVVKVRRPWQQKSKNKTT